MTTAFTITLDYPEPWFPVPLEPDADIDAWARQNAERLIAETAQADPSISRGFNGNPKRIAKEMAMRAEGYRNRGLSMAFLCYPPGLETSDVALEVMTIEPGDDDPDPSLEWFTEICTVRELGEPHIGNEELPAGPSVRLRQNYLGEKRNWFGGRPVLRSLIRGIRPPSRRALVSATTLWLDPTIDDIIEQWTDQMMESLRITESTESAI
ncbi:MULTISPECIES: hypothetical protein [Streptomyces]|nr:hypothetical protein [Streptomyces sp. AA0539]